MVNLRLADVGEVFHNVLFWLISLFALPGNYYCFNYFSVFVFSSHKHDVMFMAVLMLDCIDNSACFLFIYLFY